MVTPSPNTWQHFLSIHFTQYASYNACYYLYWKLTVSNKSDITSKSSILEQSMYKEFIYLQLKIRSLKSQKSQVEFHIKINAIKEYI